MTICVGVEAAGRKFAGNSGGICIPMLSLTTHLSHLPLHVLLSIVHIKLYGSCGEKAPEICKKRTRADCLVRLQLYPGSCVWMGGTRSLYSQFFKPCADTRFYETPLTQKEKDRRAEWR